MAIATSAPQNGISIQSEQPAAVHTHLALWALAESHFRKAHNVLLRQKSTELSTDTDGGWRQSLLAGLSCLHGVLRLCEAPRAQDRRVSRDMLVLGPEIEAKTRLRIAQVLGEWCEGPECAEQEEALLTRALMVVPASESCLDTRYSIVATQCQLFLRRGEYKWAEQKIKAALSDAQQRLVHRWVHFFALELSHLYSTSGDPLGAMGALRTAVAYAQNTGDKAAEAVVGVQLLGKMVEERLWTDASSIADKLKGLVSDPALGTLPNVKSRFWILQGASAAMLGNHAAAQEACASARYALKEWQTRFAKMMAANRVADAGSSFFIHNIPGSNGLRIQGCTYYEAHAWVMLVSAYSAHGDDAQDQSAGFLRLALEGINRGEADGFKSQLVSVKLLVLLNIVDRAIGSLQLSEAKQALDQTLSVVLENESAARTKGAGSKPRSSALWRQSRDAIALRWAMYKHRTGDLEAAADGYRCVAANGTGDLRFAARVNEIMTRLLRVHDESESAQIRKDVEMLAKETSPLPQSSAEKVRLSVVEFLQGLECTEPVKAKTCLLACLRSCTEVANTALQGWTLCLLGTLVLSTGQYTQAMKMCGAAQAMAQKANDPLQNAAAIGILVNIENAVGDPERCAQLLKVDQQFLEQFNARIAEHA
ncbi:hypothetical protein LPJ53_000168 [Coemansia erecta]|uniref:Uncharacterized protein n=1 Tax=Coemansia erecta TaxID=147472 RepID=A0A9W7Y862_9FUNG|nr:hypothetical protein LPJ53_000168 [Coemansia erecta]